LLHDCFELTNTNTMLPSTPQAVEDGMAATAIGIVVRRGSTSSRSLGFGGRGGPERKRKSVTTRAISADFRLQRRRNREKEGRCQCWEAAL
jgi:hypothetical protein